MWIIPNETHFLLHSAFTISPSTKTEKCSHPHVIHWDERHFRNFCSPKWQLGPATIGRQDGMSFLCKRVHFIWSVYAIRLSCIWTGTGFGHGRLLSHHAALDKLCRECSGRSPTSVLDAHDYYKQIKANTFEIELTGIIIHCLNLSCTHLIIFNTVKLLLILLEFICETVWVGVYINHYMARFIAFCYVKGALRFSTAPLFKYGIQTAIPFSYDLLWA